jgi:hypothetical protein
LTVSLTLAAQGDVAAIQQKLNSQFKLTALTPNGLDIAETGAGDVVELHKDGLKMSALASPLMESNTFKDGKIGGGGAKRAWGGIGVVMLQATAAGLDTTGATTVPDAIPGHNAAAGEKVWVLAATAQKDGINFKLYTDADGNGVRYHANLKILFPNKKQVPSVDEAMQLVAEVLTVVPQGDQGGQPAQDGPYAAFAGEYLFEQSGQHFFLLSDGSCSVTTPGIPQQVPCHFTVDGDWLAMTTKSGNMNMPLLKCKIQDGRLYINGNSGIELVRQGVPPAPAPEAVQAAAPVPAPMPEIAPPPPPSDAPAPMPAIAPPPPPADTPPPTIALGQTMDQVTAALGGPLKVANLGGKSIFYYKDMKVTFTNGKVSNVE